MKSIPAAALSSNGAVESGRERQEALVLLENSISELGERFRDHRPGPLTRVQLAAMRNLLSNGPITIGTLSRAIGVSFSSTTGVVDRLAQLGLVERLHPENDRRTVIVAATDAGQDVVKAVVDDRIDFVDGIFAAVSVGDLLQLHALLDAALSKTRGAVETG